MMTSYCKFLDESLDESYSDFDFGGRDLELDNYSLDSSVDWGNVANLSISEHLSPALLFLSFLLQKNSFSQFVVWI